MNVVNTPKSISIDFNSDEIRVVEGKVSKKGLFINKSSSISLPSGLYEDGVINDMDQMSYLLKNGLAANKMGQGNTNAVINSSKIIMREVAFPKVDASDIENLIKFQLGDYIPIHPEDYVVKYINLGTFLDNGTEKLNMLLIGIPNFIVESHLALLNNTGLKPMVLDYKSNAICKLLSFGGTINQEHSNDTSIAFVDMTYNNTGLTIVKDNQIKVSRIFEAGLDEKPETDELTDEVRKGIQEVIEQIEMIFRYYRTREIGNNIDLVILHGGLSKVEGIEDLFTTFFELPCIKLDTIGKLKFDGDMSLYANAVGGLIRLGGVKK